MDPAMMLQLIFQQVRKRDPEAVPKVWGSEIPANSKTPGTRYFYKQCNVHNL